MKNLNVSLETRVSKKGKEYTVLVIQLTPRYQKIVFLDNAELELINMLNK